MQPYQAAKGGSARIGLARGTPGDDWRYVSMPFPIHGAGRFRQTGAFRPTVACKEDAIGFALPPLWPLAQRRPHHTSVRKANPWSSATT
jgi:hypothetical protein